MAGTLSPSPWFQGIDANGAPVAAGKLYVYEAGTSTPATVYTDVGLTVPHANPIILDAAGRATIWLPSTGSFKFVLKTSADVLVKETDNISSVALSAALVDALNDFRQAFYFFAGSDAAALMGAAIVAGQTKAARAPGTGFFVIDTEVEVFFEATLWVEAGGAATVGIYSTGVPDTVVAGSEITSTHADGARVKTSVAFTLPAGTYFFKGHSAHASAQAWAVGYRIYPAG